MSKENLQRVKQIRRKNSNNAGDYSLPIPIGTDGLLVDMLSGLDLEQDIRLGGNHYVEVNESEYETQIIEWYLNQPKAGREISQIEEEKITHSTSIFISQVNERKIQVSSEVQDFLSVDQSSGDLIIDLQRNNGETVITISLYQGDLQRSGNLLHQKVISINENSSTFNTIEEEVDGQ